MAESVILKNPNVKFIQKNWQQIFSADMESLLEAYPVDVIQEMIWVSQNTRWNQYILRSKNLVDKAAEIYGLAIKLAAKRAAKEQPEEQPPPTRFPTSDPRKTMKILDKEENNMDITANRHGGNAQSAAAFEKS